MAFTPVGEQAPKADLSRTMAFTPVGEQAVNADLSRTMAFTPVGEKPEEGAARTPDLERTIRMAPVSQFPKGKVRDALPVENEGDTRVLPDVEGGWEPEYEQPMGSYPTSPRVLQHPQSRLRELKRKLVTGPEKEYYALSEKGLGKVQLAILLSLLVAAVAAVVTVLYGFGHIGTERHKTVIFTQLLALLFSGLLASFQLIDGVADL